MSAFDLAGDHDSASLIDQARLNPLDLSQPAGFFTGMGRGAVTGVGRLLADTQRTTGLALGAVAGSFDMLTGDAIKAQEKVFEHIVTPADKLSRHLAPKPDEIGMAGQVLHGLIKIGGEAITFGAPGVLVNETIAGTMDALDKGVDLQTAGKVGGVQGAAMTAGVIAPMTLGATGLGMNVLYGAGINLSLGVFQRGATSEIYAKAGRHDLALQFKALDGEAMAVDAILGAAFAGGGRYLQLRGEKAKSDAVAEYKAKISEMLSPEHVDAALVKNEQLKMERSGFGLPADLASRDAHVANLTGAIDDLMEGRPVTMREPVGDTIPDPAAAKVQADVETTVRAEQDAVGRAYDSVRDNPSGPAGDPLVMITPEDIDATAIARGGWHGRGDVEVKGSGWGLVKFIWKHGEKSPKSPELQIQREDVLAFPEVIRNFVSTDHVDQRGNAFREWRVMLPDVAGQQRQVVFVDKTMGDQGRRMVSLYAQEAGHKGHDAPLSKRKTDVGPESSALMSESRAGDTATGVLHQQGRDTSVNTNIAHDLRPETVIPLDDADATTTVAEAQGIITDLETAAREQETGLRAAVACFLRAA